MPPRRPTRVNEVIESIHVEPNPNILLLRRSWKWAAFCQFFHTFPDLFNTPDATVDDIESDLVETGTLVLPRIMTRLLVVLTQDRKTTINNWENTLRRQYEKRTPDTLAPLAPPPKKTESRSPTPSTRGTSPPPSSPGSAPAISAQEDNTGAPVSSSIAEEQRDRPNDVMDDAVDTRPQHWEELDIMGKLDSMHILVEWQFQNVTRFRRTVKSDGENAEWRMEPIGYDSQMNAYWLIADYRLWIQRSPPGKTTSRKRKRPTTTKPSGSQSSRRASGRPARSTPIKSLVATPSAKRLNVAQPSEPEGTPSRARAAKLKANVKLDIQAKELAHYRKTLNSRGTRLSARIRGQDEDDLGEWQAIPDDWLEPTSSKSKAGRSTRSSGRATRQSSRAQSSSAIDSDVESELTELSSDEGDVEAQQEVALDDKNDSDDDQDDSPEAASEEPLVPADFVEWETIAVTLSEWEELATRFGGSTHYREKALHKVLTHQVVPVVREHLLEIVKKREAEDAFIGRKRSSRLAGKEAQKEETRAEQERLAATARENSRAQRAEARLQREELDRQERESARERRRLERERKLEEVNTQGSSEDESVDVVSTREAPKTMSQVISTAPAKERKRRAPVGRRVETPTHVPAPPQTGAQGPFRALQLDCEVCRAQMTLTHNPGFPLVMCRVCSRAQHVLCWNTFDAANGRQPRDWSRTQFACYRCQVSHPMANNSAYVGHNHMASTTSSSMLHGYPPAGTVLVPQTHAYSSNSPVNYPSRHMASTVNQYTHPQHAQFRTSQPASSAQHIPPASSPWPAETIRGPQYASHNHMGHNTSHSQANIGHDDRNWTNFHHAVQPPTYVPTQSYPYRVQQ